MKIYVEAHEIPPEDAPPDYRPELIRVEVKESELEALMELRSKVDPNKHYIIYRHICYHDESLSKPCKLVEIGRW